MVLTEVERWAFNRMRWHMIDIILTIIILLYLNLTDYFGIRGPLRRLIDRIMSLEPPEILKRF